MWLMSISGTSNPSDTSSCPGTYNAILDTCNVTVSDTNAFYIALSRCHTPEVASISPTQGPATDTITLRGSGFSTTLCQNEVTIGGKVCNVTSATNDTITCLINTENNLAIGVVLPVEMRVNNIGSALITEPTQLERNFILFPYVDNVNPSSGSTAGGAVVTVSGGGFTSNSITVSIGGIGCSINSVSYASFTCVTANAYVSSANITVTVNANGQNIPAECRGMCQYSFTSASTPTITSASPTTISVVNDTLTLAGTGFGSLPSDVKVSIGNTDCVVLTAFDTNITCNAGSPVAGSQALVLNVAGKGKASSSVSTLTISGSVASINPTEGSTNGRTRLTMSGFGFNPSSTSATVRGATCQIITVTSYEIVCNTPSGSAGSADVLVTVGSQVLSAITFTYSTGSTPSVTALSTNSGNSGDSISITGTGLNSTGTADVQVLIGDVDCSVTSVSADSITCTVGDHSAGTFAVSVTIFSKGLATDSETFTYALTITSINNNTGKLEL